MILISITFKIHPIAIPTNHQNINKDFLSSYGTRNAIHKRIQPIMEQTQHGKYTQEKIKIKYLILQKNKKKKL